MRRPVLAPYTITTEFGVPDSYALFGYHSGVDYAVPTGRPIYAPASGTLTNVVSNTGGNMVVIFDGQFYHRLMHNQSFSRGNGWVNEGNEVARCGTTGLSTGPHCHWDININGNTARSFADFRSPADWLAGKFVTQAPQGGEMANRDQVNNLYKGILMREGDPGGLDNYTGKDANFIVTDFLKSDERKGLEASIASTKQQLLDTQQALRNEQSKPPKEVIKEVIKIVEKPVEVVKEVPVYTHDAETKNFVAAIYNYFYTRFQTFRDSIKK